MSESGDEGGFRRDPWGTVHLWKEVFDDEEGDSANDEGDCDGGEGFGEPKAGFVNKEATRDGDEKREGD